MHHQNMTETSGHRIWEYMHNTELWVRL